MDINSLEQLVVVDVRDLEELLQRVHDGGGLGAQQRAVQHVQLVRAELAQPPLQVVAVLARVEAPVPVDVVR